MEKLQQLASHHLLESMDFGDPVANLDHGTDFHDGYSGLEIPNLLPNDLVDFVSSNRFHTC